MAPVTTAISFLYTVVDVYYTYTGFYPRTYQTAKSKTSLLSLSNLLYLILRSNCFWTVYRFLVPIATFGYLKQFSFYNCKGHFSCLTFTLKKCSKYTSNASCFIDLCSFLNTRCYFKLLTVVLRILSNDSSNIISSS